MYGLKKGRSWLRKFPVVGEDPVVPDDGEEAGGEERNVDLVLILRNSFGRKLRTKLYQG
jgi:hypothetical protein